MTSTERGGGSGGSHREILRSSGIIGGASVVNILIGLLRQKATALILGPAGVGLIGLYQSLIATTSTLGSLGLGTAGTRRVAEALGRQDGHGLAIARSALFWGTLLLALLAAFLLWLLREVIARRFFADPALAPEIGWLAIAVALTVAGGSQVALLTGMRRIGDVARASIISGLLATVTGVGALLLLGSKGLLIFVIATPLATFIVGHLYVARLPQTSNPTRSWRHLKPQILLLLALGMPIMIGGFASLGGQFMVRVLIQRHLGLTDLGYFQAASMLSMSYLAFVLQAMGTDYYPRLTAIIHDREAAVRIVNEQSEVALLLGGPILIGMMGASPWILQILYAQEFSAASSVLRWQVLGDLVKVASWPIGFVLLAKGEGRTFMATEIAASALFVLAVWLGLPLFGLQAAGAAYFVLYAGYFPVVYALARRKIGFRWNAQVTKTFALLAVACFAVFFIAERNKIWGAAAAAPAAVGFGICAVVRLRETLGRDLIKKVFGRRASPS